MQAVSGTAADMFEFVKLRSDTHTEDKGHDDWIDLIDVGTPTTGTDGDPDDDGLPDIIIREIDGNGTGSATGEAVDDAGMSALLLL